MPRSGPALPFSGWRAIASVARPPIKPIPMPDPMAARPAPMPAPLRPPERATSEAPCSNSTIIVRISGTCPSAGGCRPTCLRPAATPWRPAARHRGPGPNELRRPLGRLPTRAVERDPRTSPHSPTSCPAPAFCCDRSSLEYGTLRSRPAQWCADCRIWPMNTAVSSAKMNACRNATKISNNESATPMPTGTMATK